MIFWHGTSEKRAKRALKQGLKSPYLTKDSWVKKWFAQRSADEDGSRPVIMKVEVRDLSKLRPDMEMYEEPLSSILRRYVRGDLALFSQSDWQALIDRGIVPYPKDATDWKASLDGVRSVWFDGKLPASSILDAVYR